MIVIAAMLIQASLPNVTTRVPVKLEIPDTIAPAVVPYLQCVMSERSREMSLRGAGGESFDSASKILALNDDARRKCASARTDAERESVRLLTNSAKLSEQDSRIFSQAILSSIDSVIDAPAKMFSSTPTRPK